MTTPEDSELDAQNIDFTGDSTISARSQLHLSEQFWRITLCDTEPMQSPLQTPTSATDPKSVKVNLTTGTGVDIEWKDGHCSHYNFVYLRDACPCAMCNEERDKTGRQPGEPAKPAAGALPMFKAAAKPISAEGIGKYAIRFKWNDSHDLGIYSWKFLREVCPCQVCQGERRAG
jgi:DUF971 family protein